MVSTMKRLEEYVMAMADRPEDEDIHERLRQKEKDLILAAELGKALLDKNEELSRQNEIITEEYTQKLEVLEQDKYLLRRRLEAEIGEYEVRVAELQGDVNELRRSLEEQQRLVRDTGREKGQLISELSEQNQRLTAQLKEAARKEETLTAQLLGLRDQFSLRKVAMSDHHSHLDNLREELSIISSKNGELERKIEMLLAEKEGLSIHLDDTSDRIMLLERQNREQEMQLINSRHEMDEIKSINQSLSSRLELLNRSAAVNRSLLNELELSADFRTTSGLSAASSGIGAEEDEIECDEVPANVQASQLKEFKDEIWVAYCSILAMCQQLKALKSKSDENNVTSGNSMETSLTDSCTNVKPGLLNSTLEELKSLLRDLSTIEGVETGSVKSQIEMEVRLHSAEELLTKTERGLNDKSEENKRLKEQINQLTSQLTIREAELRAVHEERDNARRDLSQTHLAKDEIVKKAWELRDQAVQRKNKAEIEVARTRIDMMQVNSQLMEAVQQKIKLSQQLEQWQVDMQQLLDEQMRMKLAEEKRIKSHSTHLAEPIQTNGLTVKKNKFLGMFKSYTNFNSNS